MSDWTREHDRIIAERCEGLTDIEMVGADFGYTPPEPHVPGEQVERPGWWVPVPHYDTDTAACHRAAEAWRKQKPGRYYETRSAMVDRFGERPSCVTLFECGMFIFATAETIHEALWLAGQKETNG